MGDFICLWQKLGLLRTMNHCICLGQTLGLWSTGSCLATMLVVGPHYFKLRTLPVHFVSCVTSFAYYVYQICFLHIMYILWPPITNQYVAFAETYTKRNPWLIGVWGRTPWVVTPALSFETAVEVRPHALVNHTVCLLCQGFIIFMYMNKILMKTKTKKFNFWHYVLT